LGFRIYLVFGACGLLFYIYTMSAVNKSFATGLHNLLQMGYYLSMISQIKGKLSYKGAGCAIIDVSGVGYKIHTALDEVVDMKEGDDVSFWTHLVVKENALDIYGFRNMENLEFFKLLIGISGIGPRSAMNILTIVGVETLVSAISSGDISYLTKVSGIGKKNAQKIIIELKDKVEARVGDVVGLKKEDIDVVEALRSLGYTTKDARDALKETNKNATTSEKIKAALKYLSPVRDKIK